MLILFIVVKWNCKLKPKFIRALALEFEDRERKDDGPTERRQVSHYIFGLKHRKIIINTQTQNRHINMNFYKIINKMKNRSRNQTRLTLTLSSMLHISPSHSHTPTHSLSLSLSKLWPQFLWRLSLYLFSLLRLRFGSIFFSCSLSLIWSLPSSSFFFFIWVGLGTSTSTSTTAMVTPQPQLQVQPQQPAPPSSQDEALKRNTDCVYFLASPLTCKKVLSSTFFCFVFLKERGGKSPFCRFGNSVF